MTTDETHREAEPRHQPPVLQDVLKSLEAARKCISLYGIEHRNAAEAADAFAGALHDLRRVFERATCIFTSKEVIVNDRTYKATPDSIDVGNRLRTRGVMAVTFVGEPSAEDIAGFLAFLNTEPRDIRAGGGASTYLRSRAVTRIVATDAVYTAEDETESEDAEETPVHQTSDVDLAIAAAIDWLSKQQEEGDESPRLPIAQILSDPDMAARLIREAVTKLHASRRGYSDGELATEVIHDLKGLAAGEAEDWDQAAPQIRRAISKLPDEMLPAASGFTTEGRGDPANAGRIANIEDVERLVASSSSLSAVDIESLEGYFGATAEGLLSSWRRELQPSSVILSSGETLETLLAWEQNAAEHGRIAIALAGTVARAVQMADFRSAVTLCQSLLSEAARGSEQPWRRTNTLSALQGVEPTVLSALVESALQMDDHRAKQTAADMVTEIPATAVAMIYVLGACKDEVFLAALARGIRSSGPMAVGALSAMVRDGRGASRTRALRILLEVSPAAAMKEISELLSGSDAEFAASAIGQLETARPAPAVDICLRALSYRAREVRIAAIHALGELGGQAAIDGLARIARRHSLRNEDPSETIAAIRALGRAGGTEAMDVLGQIADRKPFFGRGRYDILRRAAEQAIVNAQSSAEAKAA